jgi:hypothetical protein
MEASSHRYCCLSDIGFEVYFKYRNLAKFPLKFLHYAADGQGMATILELAREIRHRLVAKDTGCLTVDYDKEAVSIHFCDGSVTTERGKFLSCFARDPLDFRFMTTDVPSGESGAGVSLLIEAIESIEAASLERIWERYADWKIGFRLDPDIHNTLIKKHMNTEPERLRRIMRLAVSGSLTLEPPRQSIGDDIKRINEIKGNEWHQILSVDPLSTEGEIKTAFRKLATRLHPDRWVTTGDQALKTQAEQAFKRVSEAYNELIKPRPIPPSALPPKPKPEGGLWQGIRKIGRGLRVLKTV